MTTKYFSFDLQPKNIYDFIIFVIILIFLFILIVSFLRLNYFRIKKEKKFLITTYCKKFNLNDFQIDLVNNLLHKLFYLNVNYFFTNEVYFDKSIEYFINSSKTNTNFKKDFDEIKEKIRFSRTSPASTMEIPLNQNVKLKLKHIGFISGNIINNDEEGILIRTYFKDAVTKTKPKDEISIYYWDDVYQYEAHSVIKKISKVNYIQYLMVNHVNLSVKNKETQGFTLNSKLPVYFTHIFKLPKDIDISRHFFKGNINTFSMIGAEIFTNFKVTPNGIFLFEFHPTGNQIDKFHFTGKVEEYRKVKNGKLMFVKYLDMNESCKRYIYHLIIEKLNEQK